MIIFKVLLFYFWYNNKPVKVSSIIDNPYFVCKAARTPPPWRLELPRIGESWRGTAISPAAEVSHGRRSRTHCKKSWRSSSTPASGDAGPKHTGIEKSFRHPYRKFYYKYRTISTDFYKCRTSSIELDYLKSNITRARTWELRLTYQYSTTAPRSLSHESA